LETGIPCLGHVNLYIFFPLGDAYLLKLIMGSVYYDDKVVTLEEGITLID